MSQLLTIVFGDWRKTGHLDLEAVEMLVRGCMHQAGASALSQLLSLSHDRVAEVPCCCGQSARYHDTRPKQLLTILGPLTIQRPYYVCPHCDRGQSPRDEELDVEGSQCSPGVRRMMAVVGSDSSFDQGRQQLELLAGLKVTTKAVERLAVSPPAADAAAARSPTSTPGCRQNEGAVHRNGWYSSAHGPL